ncbi:hypothetical protein [Streptomyces sp. NPDC046887]|uniref:hypothetical protein n=1 Tax=Streptomyces sp. NPDC046887 TaxID=3155472 RepID=UPI0033CD96D4
MTTTGPTLRRALIAALLALCGLLLAGAAPCEPTTPEPRPVTALAEPDPAALPTSPRRTRLPRAVRPAPPVHPVVAPAAFLSLPPRADPATLILRSVVLRC